MEPIPEIDHQPEAILPGTGAQNGVSTQEDAAVDTASSVRLARAVLVNNQSQRS
jgi:hypothetical protein